MSEQSNLELALDLTCLVNCKELKTAICSKSAADLKALFPAVVTDRIKMKHLKKLIQPKIAEIEGLSEKEYLKRIVVSFQKVYNFDKDEFKCLLGAGEGIPVNVLIGPRTDICLHVGQSNEIRVIGFFSKIEGIQVLLQTENGEPCCQVKLSMADSSNSLVLTFDSVDDADHFVHLVDAYTGYTRMKTSCPAVLTKFPSEMSNIPEVDKTHLRRLHILDQGQFGDVFKAVLKQSNGEIEVAVKLCKAESTDEDRRLFLAEADIMRNLEHPHIVQLIGISRNEEIGIVMEFCPLGQLLSYLIDHGPEIADITLATICYQIATALAYMETKKFLHRDIAARNVLVSSVDCVKLSDFGKAVYLGEESVYQGCQEKLPVKWAAIECLASRQFSFASDVWSLGVCIWEVMSRGMKPFAELSNGEVYSVLRDSKRLPRLPNCTDNMHMLMMACWAAEPSRRPPFTTVKNKLNEIKIEMKKLEADERVLSLGAGLNRKPPIKPPFLGANSTLHHQQQQHRRNDPFTINQSMPDLLHADPVGASFVQARGGHLADTLHGYGRKTTQLEHGTQAESQLTLTAANVLDAIVDGFRHKTEVFLDMVLSAGSCSLLQLKGFGLTIRNFLQEIEREIPPHSLQHELAAEEAVLIKLFKALIRLRVAGASADPGDLPVQMEAVCHRILAQTDRILEALLRYLRSLN